MWKCSVALLCVLVLTTPVVLGGRVLAQDAPIRYGDNLPGEITDDAACRTYWFEGGAGDTIVVDMRRTSGSLDGVLWLRDARGETLGTNDDRPSGGLDPLLEATLPASGRYTIAACRLQHSQMRVTSGTFELGLTAGGVGAAGAGPQAAHLSDSVFGPSATQSPGAATPSVSVGALLAGAPAGESARLGDGSHVSGRLDAGAPTASYELAVRGGDLVSLEWLRLTGDAAPLLRVTAPDGILVADARTPDPVGRLALRFRVPDDAVLQVLVARHPAASTTASDMAFTLDVSVEAGAVVSDAAPLVEEDDAAGSGYLANPCQTHDHAIRDLGSTDRLIDVYTAAGDSYYADQLTRTNTFHADDDLNLVFRVQNVTSEVQVAGVFCAPGGDVFDAGEAAFANGGQYLIGLDWEFLTQAWIPGVWYAELYVDGAWEISLAFDVAP